MGRTLEHGRLIWKVEISSLKSSLEPRRAGLARPVESIATCSAGIWSLSLFSSSSFRIRAISSRSDILEDHSIDEIPPIAFKADSQYLLAMSGDGRVTGLPSSYAHFLPSPSVSRFHSVQWFILLRFFSDDRVMLAPKRRSRSPARE